MVSLKNGDEIELIKFGDEFYYIDGNGQYKVFRTGNGSVTNTAIISLISDGTNNPTTNLLQNDFDFEITVTRDNVGYYWINGDWSTQGDDERIIITPPFNSFAVGGSEASTFISVYSVGFYSDTKLLLTSGTQNLTTGEITVADGQFFDLYSFVKIEKVIKQQ